MDHKDIEDKIRQLITANELQEAVDVLADYYDGTEISDDLIGIQSRLNAIQNNEIHGLQDYESIMIARNNLNHNLIKILNKVKKLENGKIASIIKHGFERQNDTLIHTYIKDRVDNQIKWMDMKSGRYSRAYRRARTMIIVCASLIILLCSFSNLEGYESIVTITTGILAGVIIYLEYNSILSNNRMNWIRFREVAEKLKSEKMLFVNRTLHYQNLDDPAKVFIANIEKILGGES